MNESIESLIERLAQDIRPVRPLRPPLLRAALWFAAAMAVGMAAAIWYADISRFGRRFGDLSAIVETVAILLTALTATAAAFHLSLPDRSRAWLVAPLAPLALWVATAGYGCVQFLITPGSDPWAVGSAPGCLRFIVGASLPLGLSLFLILRRARPLAPGPVAIAGGLAVAALAAFLLDFFHPVDVTVIDLAAHFVAVGLVVGGASLASRLGTGRSHRPA